MLKKGCRLNREHVVWLIFWDLSLKLVIKTKFYIIVIIDFKSNFIIIQAITIL